MSTERNDGFSSARVKSPSPKRVVTEALTELYSMSPTNSYQGKSKRSNQSLCFSARWTCSGAGWSYVRTSAIVTFLKESFLGRFAAAFNAIVHVRKARELSGLLIARA